MIIPLLLSLFLVFSMFSATTALNASATPENTTQYSKNGTKCACVFDFDLTLRVVKGRNQDHPAEEAREVIQRCKVRNEEGKGRGASAGETEVILQRFI